MATPDDVESQPLDTLQDLSGASIGALIVVNRDVDRRCLRVPLHSDGARESVLKVLPIVEDRDADQHIRTASAIAICIRHVTLTL